MSAFGLVWRSLVVGLVYMILFMVTSSIRVAVGALAIPTTLIDPSIILLSLFIGGILTTIVVGAVSVRLTLQSGQRIGVLFLTVYMFFVIADVVDHKEMGCLWKS